MKTPRKIRIFLHILAGICLIAVVLSVDFLRGVNFYFGFRKALTLGASLVAIALGLTVQSRVLARLSDLFCLTIVILLLCAYLFEGFFSAIAFDFAREELATRAYPPFYRAPTVPIDEVYFRRAGPEEWSGQPISTLRKLDGLPPDQTEPTITVKYNELGFRQEEGYTDWDLAVTGDSFTEMGILPYDQLPTTILGKLLNLRVVNLGVSMTGPLTQLQYLRKFGVAPSTKRVMIIFFEGNDLIDLDIEFSDLMRFRKTGRREYREFKTQTSLLKALTEIIKASGAKRLVDEPTAIFEGTAGDIPISLDHLPPSTSDLPEASLRELEYFFTQYAEFARGKGLQPWLAYMPCKISVVYNNIQFLDTAPETQTRWHPTDLPETISALSHRHGIHFINLTPALVAESKRKKVLLFSVHESHLNSAGARIVGEELARQLGREIDNRPLPTRSRAYFVETAAKQIPVWSQPTR